MSRLVIVAQNLKIGGFQRIALDQCYALAKREISAELILLEKIPNDQYNNFISLEADLIEKYRIDIKYSTGSRLNQFKTFYSILRNSVEPINFLSHSLRATVLIRFAGVMSKKHFTLFTTIHQIPSLSDTLQVKKRFFYALFSHKLSIFSAPAKQDWDTKVGKSIILRRLYSKKPIELLRNGVFLERLPHALKPSLEGKNNEVRLVFIGRPTSWKGVDTILNLAASKLMENVHILFFFPYLNENASSNISDNIVNRISIKIGKSIRDYTPRQGDIHLYPANYGVESSYIEAISINCLEMSALGIPSLVTKGGLDTWPEFANSLLIHEVEWSDLGGAVNKILDIKKLLITVDEIFRFRNIIDINHHVDQLINLVENKL
jgi:glycosyltransferase involved in cell wall biosynthesis